jgi:type IV secretion system protein VirB8
MYKLFPAEKVLTYAVGFNNPETTKGIKIVPANYMAGSPLTSIAKIVVENYVINRERYKYADLKDQIVFVNSNSTKSIFNQYYNFINIDNPLSPVLRYQDQITREITPLISIFKSDTAVDVQFRSIARNSSDKIIEQMLWQASLEFKVDPIVLNQPTGTKFNFLVTNYKIKLLKNENK